MFSTPFLPLLTPSGDGEKKYPKKFSPSIFFLTFAASFTNKENMVKKCIEIERLRRLEKSIGFLTVYKTPDDEVHHIGPNIETEDVELTKLFKELGEINIRRDEIIRIIMGEE